MKRAYAASPSVGHAVATADAIKAAQDVQWPAEQHPRPLQSESVGVLTGTETLALKLLPVITWLFSPPSVFADCGCA
jgi:hypothetical protein